MPSSSGGFNLSTHSLRILREGARIERVLKLSLKAVDPGSAVRRFMARRGNILSIDQAAYDLSIYHRVRMIAFGKAAFPMALAAADILGEYLVDGLIITPPLEQVSPGDVPAKSIGNIPPPLTLLPSSHPVPTEKSVLAAQAAIQMLSDASPHDLFICLISGGGSALLAAPVPGVTLGDLQALTQQLLACGAPIGEINILRKHLDQLKGGGLVRLAGGARIIALVLSDVVGDPLDVIASGTTVPDPSAFSDAWEILERHSILQKIPAGIRTMLHSGVRKELPDTPKPGDPIFQKVLNVLVGSNILAAQAALEQAKAEGFQSRILTTYLQGEARQVGEFLGGIARQMATTGQPLPRPACLICGGETTVTVKGNGLGGRNQELALSAVPFMAGLPDSIIISLATDGIDGPTDAAGAVVTGQTLARSQALNLDFQDSLARNDAYHFFEALDDLLKPGFTHTNVNDLAFIFTL